MDKNITIEVDPSNSENILLVTKVPKSVISIQRELDFVDHQITSLQSQRDDLAAQISEASKLGVLTTQLGVLTTQ